MKEEEIQSLAQKLLRFNMQIAQWKAFHFDKEFNVNGKNEFVLTSRQFSILIVVDRLPNLTISQYGQLMGVSKSSLSLTVKKLVEDGYLIKSLPSDKKDKRSVYLYLTEKGKKELMCVENRILQVLGSFFESLTTEQKEGLKEGIDKLDSVLGGGLKNEKEA